MKRYYFQILFLLTVVLPAFAQNKVITIEAASPDPTLIVRGVEKSVDAVNDAQWSKLDNTLMLFTSAFGKEVNDSRINLVAVQVDAKMKVIKVINRSINKQKPNFSESVSLNVPAGGFVLIASDDDYTARGFKKFLAENFKEGDIVKLRIGGEIASLSKVEQSSTASRKSSLLLNNESIFTSLTGQQLISGQILSFSAKATNRVIVSGGEKDITLKINNKGFFSGTVTLSRGANYFDVKLMNGSQEVDKQPVIIYKKETDASSPDINLWVSMFPNVKTLNNEAVIAEMMQKAKEAGFTSITLDVKSSEGFVAYRKNDLSHTPYLTGMNNKDRQVPDTGIDLLQTFIEEAHKVGLKLYASFNFFVEGVITTNDYAVLKEHKDWEEIVQRPEDKGQLLRLSESAVGQEAMKGKRLALAFVNPANREVQDFQLLRVEEVLKNYNVDGIILDRCRYDNLYADFSHISRNAFAEFLRAEGKQLENFPNDAFRIDEQGNMIKGKYFLEWITFRSQVIKSFTDRLRELVNNYKSTKNNDLKMGAYVGSWYETYYQNGVNWASSDFKYNSKLDFPESELYSERYNKTGYLKNLDFLMIGTYYKTEKEIKKYITLGNILTGGQTPLIGSMSLPDLNGDERTNAFRTSLNESAGLMIFDLCYIKDWNEFTTLMRNSLKTNKITKKQ